jgi:ABC-type multidrug transport system fused ATPase/permease subunit
MAKEDTDKLAGANCGCRRITSVDSVVKAFTNEIFEVNRYASSLKELVAVAIQTARFRGFFISFVIFAVLRRHCGVGWYGATLVQTNDITVGELFSFVIYMSFIGGSIAGLGDIYTQLQRAIGASERVFEILNEKDDRKLGT